ncbi:MAG TPA: adenylate/guanylate cyclase domain-containing protein [Solimonas sp.]|nr:adenylate/guanylate cyclase domain-containing protein [Solimonas sp.]
MNGELDHLAVTMPGEGAVQAAAEEALGKGNDLLCNDILHSALQRGIRSRRLDYLRLVSLANAGSTALALRQYAKACGPEEDLDQDWLALRGRLEKDLAFTRRAGAHRHFLLSAQAYYEAFQRFGGCDNAINAASMLSLAGRTEEAQRLARQTLELAQAATPRDESDLYHLHVTEAEAALILGDQARFVEQLHAADSLLRTDVARRSRTARQLRRLCKAMAVDPGLVSALRLPPVILLRRVGGASTELPSDPDIPRGLATSSLVFCGIRDPLDLSICEALQANGVRLYIALPQAPPRMLEQWAAAHGEAWARRLGELVAGAERVSICRGFLDHESGWYGHHLTVTTLGLSLLTAGRLSDIWRMVDVEWRDGRIQYSPLPEIENVDNRAQLALAQAGFATHHAGGAPEGRRMVGLIFADFAGFNRVGDAELPRYWSDVMGGIAQLIRKYGKSVLLRQTWGDALHVVTSDAVTAAELAVDIQDYIELRRLKEAGALARLELRLAAHFAPAYAGHDPVSEEPTYFGSQLSFTARIEPVVPPGMIYVSEAFAARVALEAPRRFGLEYAGDLELAKQAGKFQLYSLRRR